MELLQPKPASLNLAHKGLAELTGPREEAGAEPGGIRGFWGESGRV